MQCHQVPLCWAAQDRWPCTVSIKCLALPKHTCSAASVSRDTHRGTMLQRLTAHGTEPAKTSQELCHQPRPVPCWSRSWCCWPDPIQQRGLAGQSQGCPSIPTLGQTLLSFPREPGAPRLLQAQLQRLQPPADTRIASLPPSGCGGGQEMTLLEVQVI